MLVSKTVRRKDWEDKARVGYFIGGYSDTKAGYRVLRRKDRTSVHRRYGTERTVITEKLSFVLEAELLLMEMTYLL